jgi:Fe-Mn family superoxide dismutase
MAHTLPNLPYPLNALEPHIDAKTMEIHHGKHHAAYVAKLNEAIAGTPFEKKSLEELIGNIAALPKEKQAAVRNNGGGHYNHSLFWTLMAPKAGGEPTGELAAAIKSDLGGFNEFKEKFTTAALTRFGSGWAWLCIKDGKLCVCSTPNQDNPLMDVAECKGLPILGIDVWEHAYYLKYQNKRPDYIAAFFNVIDWNAVAKRYKSALSGKSK